MAQRSLSITTSQRKLVEAMQSINFGRIERLEVRGGQPAFASTTLIVREIKFGAENGPRRESRKSDFELKAAVCELLTHLEALGEGVVARIEIQRGLPFRMVLEEVAA